MAKKKIIFLLLIGFIVSLLFNLWGQIFDLDKTVTMKDLTPKTGI